MDPTDTPLPDCQNILETIVDIFDPLVGMGKATSSAELTEKARGASFADKLFTPLSGKPQDECLLKQHVYPEVFRGQWGRAGTVVVTNQDFATRLRLPPSHTWGGQFALAHDESKLAPLRIIHVRETKACTFFSPSIVSCQGTRHKSRRRAQGPGCEQARVRNRTTFS